MLLFCSYAMLYDLYIYILYYILYIIYIVYIYYIDYIYYRFYHDIPCYIRYSHTDTGYYIHTKLYHTVILLYCDWYKYQPFTSDYHRDRMIISIKHLVVMISRGISCWVSDPVCGNTERSGTHNLHPERRGFGVTGWLFKGGPCSCGECESWGFYWLLL